MPLFLHLCRRKTDMKAATVHEIKEAILHLPPAKVAEICLRLARFKKENKELLTYILFESENLDNYLAEVKAEMETEFSQINQSQLYFAKKSLRRILRDTNKQVRYIGSKPAEVELLLAYCQCLKQSGIPIKRHPAIENLYLSQIKKIGKLITGLHEDLQYEYQRALDKLQ
ncbi:hypothetical protein ACFSQD_13325 [Flavihumibacter stibioxidans]|nr:hypothetical protein [Flavihumibacter stibioxidans]